jgi:hypothetical protein
MSTNKYIIQNCSNSNRYRITINGTSHLSVGETWNIECDVIENGCSNVKFEVNVDDCSFIEYGTCYQCEEDNTPLNETILTESSTTPTLTPSELSGVRVPTYAYVALLYDCNGNGPYEFAIETNY